jgi:hypothetical protein
MSIRSSLFRLLTVCCIASLVGLSKHKPDRSKILISQLASKAYYTGEIAGLRLAGRGGQCYHIFVTPLGLMYGSRQESPETTR